MILMQLNSLRTLLKLEKHQNVRQMSYWNRRKITAEVIGNVNKENRENTISEEKKMESDYWTKHHLMQEDLERNVIKFTERFWKQFQ
jgi:hypothetical protein